MSSLVLERYTSKLVFIFFLLYFRMMAVYKEQWHHSGGADNLTTQGPSNVIPIQV